MEKSQKIAKSGSYEGVFVVAECTNDLMSNKVYKTQKDAHDAMRFVLDGSIAYGLFRGRGVATVGVDDDGYDTLTLDVEDDGLVSKGMFVNTGYSYRRIGR